MLCRKQLIGVAVSSVERRIQSLALTSSSRLGKSDVQGAELSVESGELFGSTARHNTVVACPMRDNSARTTQSTRLYLPID